MHYAVYLHGASELRSFHDDNLGHELRLQRVSRRLGERVLRALSESERRRDLICGRQRPVRRANGCFARRIVARRSYSQEPNSRNAA